MHSNEPVRNKDSTERSMCRTWAFYNETEKNRELLLQLVHLNWKFWIYLSVHYVPSIMDAEYKPCWLKTVYFFKLYAVLYLCWLHQNLQQQAVKRSVTGIRVAFSVAQYKGSTQGNGSVVTCNIHSYSELKFIRLSPLSLLKKPWRSWSLTCHSIHSYCVILLSLTAIVRD